MSGRDDSGSVPLGVHVDVAEMPSGLDMCRSISIRPRCVRVRVKLNRKTRGMSIQAGPQ